MCISCGRPAELAGSKCKPCGDMDGSLSEFGFTTTTTTKTLSLSDLKPPGASDDHSSDGGGKSSLSLPNSTAIPQKPKRRGVHIAVQTPHLESKVPDKNVQTVPTQEEPTSESFVPGSEPEEKTETPGGVHIAVQTTHLESKAPDKNVQTMPTQEEPTSETFVPGSEPEEKTKTSEEIAPGVSEDPMPSPSSAKGIGLQHRKSKKETDDEFDLLMATTPKTRFCGGEHTMTMPQQRGVRFADYGLPSRSKETIAIIGKDQGVFRGSFPAEKDGELPFDVDPSSVNMEEILESCFQPYPPLPPREYYEAPRYCGGQHTMTEPLQRGLKFAAFKMSPNPASSKVEVEGQQGVFYRGIQDVRDKKQQASESLSSNSMTKTDDGKDSRVEIDSKFRQPAVINLGLSSNAQSARQQLHLEIPSTQLQKVTSTFAGPGSKKNASKKGK